MAAVASFDSSKSRPMVGFRGHQYRYVRSNAVGRIRWRCRSSRCNGGLWTDGQRLHPEEVGCHAEDCHPDTAAVNISQIKTTMKARARDSLTPISSIYRDAVIEASQLSDAVASRFDTFDSHSSALYRTRLANLPPLPQTREEIVLNEMYRQTLTEQRFLLFRSDDSSIFIFTSDAALTQLSRMGHWAMDGTFGMVPALFQQLYTVHGFLEDKVLPLVYALTANKDRETYVEIFRRLRDGAAALNLQLQPHTVSCDFESGLLPALQQEFPAAAVRGCHFHHCQAIYRKVQRLGLANNYRDDEEVQQTVRELMAIAFVPVARVQATFDALRADAPAVLQPLFEYYLTWWIETTPLPLWNMFQVVRRTNNNVEGWHSKLSKLFGKAHPNLFEFVKQLQKEEAEVRGVGAQMGAGNRVVRRNKKYAAINARISTLTERYVAGNTDELGLIQGVAYNLSQPLHLSL